MYLDQIQIHGFKSFGDVVKLEIPKGITAVIGPNGSGKSNVADAIRWVLGEQSAKTLRGVKMEDIIFAGTEKRKSLGYAEVSMHIQNPDRKLPIDYSEIVVKRRVYRSGESEYFLNGSSCRLKDIQELFMDTGVGKEGYSIIGQGQIDKILSSKPEERRSLFEEAAGVYKYKVRRQEAERKLEKERENLLRVKDILVEIEDRLAPLEVEAQKTREYLSLKDKLKEMDINIFIQEIQKMKIDIAKVEENLGIVEEQMSSEVQNKEQLTAAYVSWKHKNQALFDTTQQAIQHIADLEKKQQQEQSQIEINKERLTSIDTLLNQIDQDTQKQETVNQNMQIELQILNSKKVALELEQTTQMNILQKSETVFEEAEKKLKQIEATLETSKTTLYEKIHQIDIFKTEIEKHEALETQADYRHDKVIETIERLNSDIRHQEVALQVLNKNQKEKQERIMQVEEAFNSEDIRKVGLEKQNDTKRKEMDTLTQNIAQTKRQMNWLEQIKNDYEGYYASVKQVLTLKKSEPRAWEGVMGIVADLLDVPKQYELAIVTALGGSMQNVVTQTESDAKAMIATMKKCGISRVTFLPRDTVKSYASPAESEHFKKEIGFLGLASDIIGYDTTYSNIVSFLLGRILIVDTIENASFIARKYGHKYKIVTLEGDVFNAGGSLTGGSTKGNANNIFSRSRELKELKITYDQGIEQQEALQKSLAKLEEERRSCVASWEALSKELIGLQDNQKEIAFEMSKQASSLELTKKSQIELVEEKNKLQEDKQKIKDDQKLIENKIEALEEQIESSKDSVSDLEEVLNALKENKEKEASELTEKKIALSTTMQNVKHIVEQIKTLEDNIMNTKEQSQSIVMRKETLYEDRQKIERTNEQLQEEIEKLEQIILEAQNNKKKHEQEKEALSKEEIDIQDKMNKVAEVIDQLKQERFRLSNKKEILNLEYKKINDSIWEQYELTYNNALPYKKDFGHLVDLKKDADKLRARIRVIGNVNVNAVVDYEETKRRYTFLNDQKLDVEKAENALLELIQCLTDEMKGIFKEQFASIAENFTYVFKELFGGGMAFLQLTDEENILESGIEIIAKPPGKKLQNMTLLSGGERTLTAIALLFGILKLKPSPFCVLDEIEAALDDANVLRFADYLNSLSKETQFIVITHRKGTMERADTLYGVTMQERGVSTVLSIKLEEATEYLDQKSS